MPTADVVDDKIVIRTEYHERHLVKQVPGSGYNQEAGYWTAPLGWSTCIILRGLFGNNLLAGIELTKWSWDLFTSRIEPAVHLRDAMRLSADDPVAYFIDLVESRAEGASETA